MVLSSEPPEQVWTSHWQRYAPSRGEHWLIEQRQRLLNQALAQAPSRHNKPLVVVEAGCGAGHNSLALASSSFVIGCDISEAALVRHRSLYSASQVTLVNADIRHLPFTSHSADMVFNAGVLEHFTDGEKIDILCEFRRILRREGILLITVPGRYSFWHLWRRTGQFDFGYEEYHTPSSIRAVSEAAGFETIATGGLDPLSLNTFLVRFCGFALPLSGLPGGFSTEVYLTATPCRA